MTEKEQEDIKDNISEEEISQKDTDTLIREDGKTFDVYDLLEENKSDPVVVKINNLIREGGITAEIVAEKYSEVAGGIADKDLALTALDSVFIDLALSITAKPNGIVIDLTTGLKDEILSQKQAEELGISDEEYSMPNDSKQAIIQASIEKSLEKYQMAKQMKKNSSFNRGNFVLPKGYDNMKEYIKDIYAQNATSELSKEEEEKQRKEVNNYKTLSKESKNKIFEIKKRVAKIDPEYIDLIELAGKLNNSKGTPQFSIIVEKLDKLFEKRPEFKEKYTQIVDENGNLKQENKLLLSSYNRDLSMIYFFKKVGDKAPNELANMSKEAKKDIMLGFVSGIQLMGKENFREETIQIMGTIFPEFKEIVNSTR